MPNTNEPEKLELYDGTYYFVDIGQRPGMKEELTGYRVINKQTDVVEDFTTVLMEANAIAKGHDEWANSISMTEAEQAGGNITRIQ